MARIAYFGPQGTFTEQAARQLGFSDAELVPKETIRVALTAVREETADAACVPVENSVEGAVTATLDGLAEGDPLVVTEELLLPVRFSVLIRPGTKTIRTVASHPHALAQVRNWLAEHLPDSQQVAASSTAAAAVGVQRGDFDAAVTAPVAVQHYPLDVLATDVADVADAQTRFLLVRPPGLVPPPTGFDRTSVVAVTENRVGALSELLTELAVRGIDLTKLDVRPLRNFGEYRFFIDFAGHVAEPRVGDALAALWRRCHELRFLGSHPRADEEPDVAHVSDNHIFESATAWVAAVRAGQLA